MPRSVDRKGVELQFWIQPLAGFAVLDLIDFKWRARSDWEASADQWQSRGVTKPPDGTYTAWWHSAEDTLDKMSPEALAFAGNLVWHALPDIETTLYAK